MYMNPFTVLWLLHWITRAVATCLLSAYVFFHLSESEGHCCLNVETLKIKPSVRILFKELEVKNYLWNLLSLCNIHKGRNNKGDKRKTPLWCPQTCMYLLWSTAYVLFTRILAGTTTPSLLRCSHMVKNMRTKQNINSPETHRVTGCCLSSAEGSRSGCGDTEPGSKFPQKGWSLCG